MTTLEVAVETADDARAAAAGGADTVELSQELARDGLTPDLDLAQTDIAAGGVPVHILLRPNERDFRSDDAECARILADARRFAALGAAGVVFGAHDAAGRLHLDQMRAVAAAAPGLTLTLHRAVDSALGVDDDLAALIGVAARVLTSGPAPNADLGRAGLRRWCARYGEHFHFIAAGGVRLAMLPALIDETGAAGVHVGGAARVAGVVQAAQVAQLRKALG